MPNIVEYTAPNADINPSERGAAAWGHAGSRIGTLANEEASFQRQAGSLAAAAAKQRMWPFDILKLYQIQAAQEAKEAAGGGGDNVKIANRGRASDPFAAGRTTGAIPQGIEQLSAGVGALGRGLADGGYQAARMPQGGGGSGGGIEEPSGPDYTLLGGELVSMRGERQAEAERRAGIDKEMGRYWREQTDLRDYWTRYNGLDPATGGPYGDPSGFTPSTSTGGYGGDVSAPSPDIPSGGSPYNPLNWF